MFLPVRISSFRKRNLSSLWFANREEYFRQNYGILWIIHSWNKLFDVSKSHQKGKALCSSCSLCHVLTINASPREKSWQRPCTAMVKNHSEQGTMCQYWYIIINLMLNFLVFIRWIREGNVLKWCYARGHYHYARWATVHLYDDLVNLPTTSPYLCKYFSDGYFAFQKSNKKISLMRIDQDHE